MCILIQTSFLSNSKCCSILISSKKNTKERYFWASKLAFLSTVDAKVITEVKIPSDRMFKIKKLVSSCVFFFSRAMAPAKKAASFGHQGLIYGTLLVALTISCRYIGKHYFAANNQVTVEMPTESDFATAKKDKSIFFFDLGGTMCMCDKKWVVKDYWSKVFSGFAFNFAHVVGTFEFYVLLVDYKLILIAVFINEMIEELWLTSGYWGFTLDPPYDQEARYDSLVRDTICCMLGLHLAIRFGNILKVTPLVKWPIRFSNDGRNNPHDVRRWLKFALQSGCMWQITLIFNADNGPFHFNLNNVFLIFCYSSAVFLFFLWNINDYPDCSRRHVFCWYFGWAFVVMFVFGFAVYPVFRSAMYLILCVESLLSLTFTILEAAINSYPAYFEELIFQRQKSSSFEVGGPNSMASVPLNLILKCCDELDFSGRSCVSFKDFADLVNARMDNKKHISMHNYRNIAENYWTTKRQLELGVSVMFRLAVLYVAISQPLLYNGVQYKRHWCGNPNVKWGNGCSWD